MKLQKLTNYLFTHQQVALLLTFAITCLCAIPGGALFAGFGMIFAALVTLVKGPRDGAIYTVAATIPYAIFGMLASGSQDFWYMLIGGTVAICAGNILTYFCAAMLYRKSNWSQVILLQALLGVFVVSVVHLVFPDIVAWWTQRILASLTEFTKMLEANGYTDVVKMNGNLPDIASSVGQMATGLTVAMILAVNLMQLVISRWWQSKVYIPGVLSLEMRHIRMSRLAGLFFVASIGLYFFGNAVISDIMPIMILTFAAAGLSLMHYYFALMPKSASTTFIIVLIYFVIFAANVYSMVFLAGIGLADVWLDFRRSLTKV